MATSRLARLFGRGRHDGTADTAPPAYTGIGAPRPYDPPPGSPGRPPAPAGPPPPRLTAPPRPAPPQAPSPVPGPRPAPSPYEHTPVVTRAQYDDAVRRRRAADQEVGTLERFEARLNEQIRTATEQERHDYVRELLARRIAVRARLEEATLRRNRLRQTEEELGAGRAVRH